MSLNLSADQISSVVKELKISTKADIKANLGINNVLALVRQYVHVPSHLHKTSSPAGPAFYGSDQGSSYWDGSEDESSWYGSDYSTDNSYWGAEEEYDTPAEPWLYEELLWDEDWGYLSSPYDFFDGQMSEWTIAYWAEEAGEQVIFAACIDAFLASERLA